MLFLPIAGCSDIDTNVNSHAAINYSQKPRKIYIVIENVEKVLAKGDPTDDIEHIMTSFDESFSEILGKCGVTVNYMPILSSAASPTVQSALRDFAPDAILRMQVTTFVLRQNIVNGISGIKGLTKASFNMVMYNAADNTRIWDATAEFDRSPKLYSFGITRGSTGADFAEAVATMMKKDGVTPCQISASDPSITK